MTVNLSHILGLAEFYPSIRFCDKIRLSRILAAFFC